MLLRFGWLAMVAAVPALAQSGDRAPPHGDTAPIDYSRPSSWICRPGMDDGSCSANLDAVRVDAAGIRTPAPHVAASDPGIDCFYVYPTASNDPSVYSDLDPREERHVTHGQAARLGARCRLFAPIYHQLTLTALRWSMSHPGGVASIDFGPAYADVLAAWKSYLAHDNQGRGVVLFGHSQGAILLKRLIAEQIDGKPAQKLLVGAYLAGNPDLTTRSFRRVPPCARVGETGCVTAWSIYLDTPPTDHVFGAAASGGEALCTNPASLDGGRALLDPFLTRPTIAPAGDPPYVEAVGQISAACVRDAHGAVLSIHVEPGRYADLLKAGFEKAAIPGWGLHSLDVGLVQGNMLALIGAQAAAWKTRR